ncbi:TonB-dependent receptor [Thermomonas sp. S9]|uniref:TonB-dependent receptor plug domain-containing protein n=1 Tax=Thermomonas sp. S9 TaxID=2885203 RepID=UPI00216AF8F5|nr:TonB-dependent receptor [Thermomonas sp. S9]MCR6495827.1 TonB-dependent receptor [Thermomonas sp. S9]
MAVHRRSTLPRRPLALALAALLLPAAAMAQDQNAQSTQDQKPAAKTEGKAKDLDKVVVTGSLIPQTQVETFVPVTIISAEDIQARGFNNVAEVLQKSSFATGGVQNNQSSASFTQGAETLSLFGLSPSYVKYLIDGRPMANYPALYNGTDVFNNISGIPVDLVDRIEILPGGQSSLYGSDAIAGVVNIILKKNIDSAVLSGRVGGYDEGGGRSGRLSYADSFASKDGRWNTLLGVQVEKVDPVWAYQRDLTKQFNLNAYNGAAPLASRDWLVYSPFTSYNFMDPNNCANVKAGFGGTVDLQTRPGFGDTHYCGSFYTPGYRTLKNQKESAQLYVHSTFDLTSDAQLYADVLLNQEKVKYHIGSNYVWWGTSVKWGYYYDPNLDDFLNLQRAFTPEDMGGWKNTMDENKSTSYAVTVGVNGTVGGNSNWDYDVSISRTHYKLDEISLARLADPINDYFQQHVLGPQLGLDPYYDAYPVFTPNYAAFYTLMSPADFYSFMGKTVSRSSTYDNLLRAQFTNGALFSLPGGDAGVAIAVEAGTEGWSYNPDPLLLDGKIWGTTAVSGNGSRSRYAVTGEMRLPVWDKLTLAASARYDAFRAAGRTIDKPTYSLGLEYRPFESLLVRGKYGTAFKAPTLADQFQGVSGFYSSTVDYYNCALLGFDAGNVDQCPARYSNLQYFGQQSGNPDLKPINAKVWSYGVVWAPTARFSVSADYYHWNIKDEVALQNVDQLMRDEANCRLGTLDINSGTCQAALSQVHRGAAGTVQSIDVKKVNIASESLNAVALGVNYRQDLGAWGELNLSGNWTRNLKHEFQQYPGDPTIDLLSDPYWSTDPKYKASASAGWNLGRWTTTVYANYLGPTPNYRATLTPAGYGYAGAGRLGSYTTLNASVNFDVTEDLKLSLLVNNLANRMPNMDVHSYPGSSGAPYNSSNFDVLGRAYYLEAKWSFGKSK